VVAFFIITGFGLDYDIFLLVRVTELRAKGMDRRLPFIRPKTFQVAFWGPRLLGTDTTLSNCLLNLVPLAFWNPTAPCTTKPFGIPKVSGHRDPLRLFSRNQVPFETFQTKLQNTQKRGNAGSAISDSIVSLFPSGVPCSLLPPGDPVVPLPDLLYPVAFLQ
jgi:hypothetical protein